MRVVCIGAAVIDIKSKPDGTLSPGSTSNGKIYPTTGGVALAMSRNFAQLDNKSYLMTLIGHDLFGDLVIKDAKESGVNISAVQKISHKSTASYVALLDDLGNTKFAIFDGNITQDITISYLKENRNLLTMADLIVVNTNIPIETIDYIGNFTTQHNIPLYVNTTAAPLAPKVFSVLDKTYLLGVNETEAEALVGSPIDNPRQAIEAGKILLTRGVKKVILTLGAKGVIYCDPKTSYHIEAFSSQIIETTGAGDALCSAFLHCHFEGYDVLESLKFGLAAAALTVESKFTVSPHLSFSSIYQRQIGERCVSDTLEV